MVNWTKELKLCALDTSRAYMISTYCFNSRLWKGQENLLRAMKCNDIVLSVKSRRVGYTSLMAAFTACELVLNCDVKREEENTDIVYIAPNWQMGEQFKTLVAYYISRIPKELWTTSYEIMCSKKFLRLGNTQLMVTLPGSVGFSDSNSKRPSYTIYDEVITRNDEFDFENSFERNWFEISDKVIIGGCGNHRNIKFYEFVKKYKENFNPLIKMKWDDNPNNSYKEYYCKKNWVNDPYEFADEFDCEIFKLVKESL